MLWFFANGLFEHAYVNGIDVKGIKQAWGTCLHHYDAWKATMEGETLKHIEKVERQRAANALMSPSPRPGSQVGKSWPKHILERAERKFENGNPKLRASWTHRWQRKEATAKLFVELGVGSRRGGAGTLRAVKTLARVQLRRIKDANDAECGSRSLETFGIYEVGRRNWFLLGQECPSAGEVRKVLGGKAKQYFSNFLAKRNNTA